MKMNLREALHMCELRTMPQGHPDYRFICQEMWRKIQFTAIHISHSFKSLNEPARSAAMCELRTMPQGHPDYRFISQEMWRKIQEVHPALAEVGKIHRLAKIPSRPVAIRNENGVQEVDDGEAKIER